MKDIQMNVRKANQFIINNLADLEGSFVKKLGEKNLQRIRDTYEKALVLLDHDNSTLVARPVTLDQSKVSLEGNKDAVQKAENIIHALDSVESSDLIEEYEELQARLKVLTGKLEKEHGQDFQTYKRMNGHK